MTRIPDHYFLTIENENNPTMKWDCGECTLNIVGDIIWADKVDGSSSYLASLNNTTVSIKKRRCGPEELINYYDMNIKILKYSRGENLERG